MKIKLFSYGTIQEPKVQLELFGKELKSTTDSIGGYIVINDLVIDGIAYPRLSPNNGGIVHGSIYELSPEQLAILDEYETDAYQRVSIKTMNGCGVQVYFPLSI